VACCLAAQPGGAVASRHSLQMLVRRPGHLRARAVALRLAGVVGQNGVVQTRPAGRRTLFRLDTIIVGDIAPLVNISRTTLLRDVYAPQHLGSGLMYLTETDRGRVWERWSGDPEGWLRTHASAGDQNMIELAHSPGRLPPLQGGCEGRRSTFGRMPRCGFPRKAATVARRRALDYSLLLDVRHARSTGGGDHGKNSTFASRMRGASHES
jgi:hypothetical protein